MLCVCAKSACVLSVICCVVLSGVFVCLCVGVSVVVVFLLFYVVVCGMWFIA